MSNEAKMREKFLRWSTDGRKLGTMELLFAEDAWIEATSQCAAIKDAEIASRDLMIKELREALESAKGFICVNGMEDSVEVELIIEALANSEHHNSRALDKMLLEARIDEIKRLSCWHPIEGNWEEFVRAQARDYEIRLAELNNE